MPQPRVKPRRSARCVWLSNVALGAMLTTWVGFLLAVLIRWPPGRAAAFWAAALVLAGLGVSLAVFLSEIRQAIEEPPAARSDALRAALPLGPDRRADRAHARVARPRRFPSRFRNPGL